MKQLTDQSFNKIENAIVLQGVPMGNSEPSLFDRKSNWKEKEFSKIIHGEENIEESLTATYWG
jgi:hypothetical protein